MGATVSSVFGPLATFLARRFPNLGTTLGPVDVGTPSHSIQAEIHLHYDIRPRLQNHEDVWLQNHEHNRNHSFPLSAVSGVSDAYCTPLAQAQCSDAKLFLSHAQGSDRHFVPACNEEFGNSAPLHNFGV